MIVACLLIMGSFSLLFRNFPSDSYQLFIRNYLDGAAVALLDTLYNISLGSLALILSVTISLSYGLLAEPDTFILYPVVSVCSYLAFCGGIQEQEEYIFNAEWVFTAMCITLLSCILFRRILKLSNRLDRLHTTGAEYLFNISIQSLFPVIIILVFFAAVGYLLRSAWGSSNITNFGSYIFLKLFDKSSNNLFGILLYVIITHILWFFGIHGTNTLEAVSRRLLEPNVSINQSLLLAGNVPTEIFSKTFLDTFVFLGGCGCALSFVIALCIASRKSHNRKIAYVALPSAFFNISEIAVFGFPIIFNFTMAVPFILTPVVLTLTSYLAAAAGLVPVVTQSVDWTVPLLFSGYKATGSLAGSFLQLINVLLGVCIYIPFIKRSEQKETAEFQRIVRCMESDMAAGESSGTLPTRPIAAIRDAPSLMRYFAAPKPQTLLDSKLDEREFVVRFVTRVNREIGGAYVFSCGKNMGVFKAVGYPEDVGEFYRLEEYEGYAWTAHGRYPTNTPGWWGGAHPFSILDYSVVHNGEISSYDANRRFIEMYGYNCSLLTDTEVITYIIDFLVRRKGLTLEEAAGVIAAPFWSTIEQMPEAQRERLAYLRETFASLLITGPFSILLGFTGGMMALNDRLKLRSMVCAEKGEAVYFASEECAIRVMEPDVETLWAPRGGQAVVVRLNDGVTV